MDLVNTVYVKSKIVTRIASESCSQYTVLSFDIQIEATSKLKSSALFACPVSYFTLSALLVCIFIVHYRRSTFAYPLLMMLYWNCSFMYTHIIIMYPNTCITREMTYCMRYSVIGREVDTNFFSIILWKNGIYTVCI